MKISDELSGIYKLACKSESNVLITGSTGTGKTSLARKIHDQSKRQAYPFVSINLATLHEGTLESELFGHEKGSFTGADKKRTGRIELANGGTVFLDEIGELTPRLQARLLEFLQSRVISPVGSNRETRLDVRVITATHKNLEAAVVQGQFREDLFHRLRVISIQLKTLSERSEEFDSLVHTCLQNICLESGKSVRKLSASVAEKLEEYHWPGNIRELRNVLEYAVQASEGDEIDISDLPIWLIGKKREPNLLNEPQFPVLGVAEVPLTLDYYGTFERFEKEYLARALSRNGGRINRTARQIGMNKTTLLRRLRAYSLNMSLPSLCSK